MKVLEFNMKIWSQFGGAGVQYADSGVTAENGTKRSGTETFWSRGMPEWSGGPRRPGAERRHTTAPESRSGADFCSVFRCDGGSGILDGTPENWRKIFRLNGSPSYWAEVQTELANCSGT